MGTGAPLSFFVIFACNKKKQKTKKKVNRISTFFLVICFYCKEEQMTKQGERSPTSFFHLLLLQKQMRLRFRLFLFSLSARNMTELPSFPFL